MNDDLSQKAGLSLYLLGTPSIRLGSAALTTLGPAKAYALLYYLATTQRIHTRVEVAEFLWPNSLSDVAFRNLRNLLVKVRQHVGDYLTITTESLGLNPDASSYYVDVHDLIAIAHRNSDSSGHLSSCPHDLQMHENNDNLTLNTIPPNVITQYRHAVSLYRGDFLSGFRLSNAPAFNDWVTQTRDEMRTHVAMLLYSLARAAMVEQNIAHAYTDIDHLLTLVPWHEEAHRLKMILLYQTGQRWAALEQFKTLEEILRQELDVAPDPETNRLVQKIRSGEMNPAEIKPVDSGFAGYLPPEMGAVTNTIDTSNRQKPSPPVLTPLPGSKAEAPRPNMPHCPAPLTPLVGHHALLQTALGYLRSPDHRLITLMGMGGVGKTHIALTLGQILSEALDASLHMNLPENMDTHLQRFVHGVCFIPLAGMKTIAQDTSTDGAARQSLEKQALRRSRTVKDSQPQLYNSIANEIAAALALPVGSASDVLQQVMNYLHKRELLLILDSFEHILDAGPLLTLLLQEAPLCTFLVTSHTRLHLHGETVLYVDPLPIPALAEVESLVFHDVDLTTMADPVQSRYAAVQLFIDCARRYSSRFHIHRADFADIIAICTMTGGLPLALEMVAAWTEHLTLSQIVVQLKQHRLPLTLDVQDTPTRHHSIDALFEYSWQRLSDEEKEPLMMMAHFATSFDQAAMTAIIGISLSTLKTLTDTSFVQVKTIGRYELHPLTQTFLQDKWLSLYGDNSPKTTTLWLAYCTYYLTFLCDQAQRLNHDDEADALMRLRREQNHINLAWQQAVIYRKLALIQLAFDPLIEFYRLSGAYQDLFACCQRLKEFCLEEDCASQSDPSGYPFLFHAELVQAETHAYLLQYADGLKQMKSMASLVENLTDAARQTAPTLEVRYYLCYANTLPPAGEAAQASVYYHIAHQRLLQLRDAGAFHPQLWADYERSLMSYTFYQGNVKQSVDHAKASLTYYRQAGNRRKEANTLVNISLVLATDHRLEDYVVYLHEALAINRQLGSRRGETRVLLMLSQNQSIKNPLQRIAHLKDAIAIYEDLGEEATLTNPIGELSREYIRLGQYTHAHQLLISLLTPKRALEDNDVHYLTICHLSIVAYLQEDSTEALRLAKQAVTMQDTIRYDWRSFCFMCLGYAYLANREFRQAQTAFEDLLKDLQQHGHTQVERIPRTGFAEVAYAQGNYLYALSEVEQLLSYLDDDPDIDTYLEHMEQVIDYFRLHWVCYQVLKAMDDPRTADVLTKSYEKLQQWADGIDDEPLRFSFLQNVVVNRMIVEEMHKVRD
ncbi:MAG: BTAD domain-containing putative transcriptional regulator [Chloroflexota bacterium]